MANKKPSRSDGPADVARAAAEQVEDLIGQDVAWISGIERSDDKWQVTVEVVELERIPPTTNILASYEVLADGDGNVLQLNRTRRYVRNRTDEDES
jgi:hypothetical protein